MTLDLYRSTSSINSIQSFSLRPHRVSGGHPSPAFDTHAPILSSPVKNIDLCDIFVEIDLANANSRNMKPKMKVDVRLVYYILFLVPLYSKAF